MQYFFKSIFSDPISSDLFFTLPLFFLLIIVFNYEIIKKAKPIIKKKCKSFKDNRVLIESWNKQEKFFKFILLFLILLLYLDVDCSFITSIYSDISKIIVASIFNLISLLLMLYINDPIPFVPKDKKNKNLLSKLLTIIIYLISNYLFFRNISWELSNKNDILIVTFLFNIIILVFLYLLFLLIKIIYFFISEYILLIEPNAQKEFAYNIIVTQMFLVYLFVITIFCKVNVFCKISIIFTLSICYILNMSYLFKMIKNPFSVINKNRDKKMDKALKINEAKIAFRFSIIITLTIIFNLYIMTLWSHKFIEAKKYENKPFISVKQIFKTLYETITCFISVDSNCITANKPESKIIILIILITSVICLVIFVSVLINTLSSTISSNLNKIEKDENDTRK